MNGTFRIDMFVAQNFTSHNMNELKQWLTNFCNWFAAICDIRFFWINVCWHFYINLLTLFYPLTNLFSSYLFIYCQIVSEFTRWSWGLWDRTVITKSLQKRALQYYYRTWWVTGNNKCSTKKKRWSCNGNITKVRNSTTWQHLLFDKVSRLYLNNNINNELGRRLSLCYV